MQLGIGGKTERQEDVRFKNSSLLIDFRDTHVDPPIVGINAKTKSSTYLENLFADSYYDACFKIFMRYQKKLLSAQEINKFSTLVKSTQAKLGATDLVRLDPSVYRDYIQKIKQFAGTSSIKQRKLPTKQAQSQHVPLKKMIRPSSQSKMRPVSSNPSFYYNNNMEIISMKEFIVLLEESKRKQQRQLRAQTRLKEKQLVQEVGRRIQSSHSRNLRLTSSSARRISVRIKEKEHSNMYDC